MDEMSKSSYASPSVADWGKTPRTVRIVLGGALVALLLALLFSKDTFRQAEVWAAFTRAPWAVLAITLVTAVAQTALSTLKWHRLMCRAAPELARRSGWVNLFHYTAGANALGQILTPYIAGTLVRAWWMRSRHAGRLGPHALLAGFEQVFDVVILLVGGTVALAVFAFGRPEISSLWLLGACLLLGPLLWGAAPEWARPFALAVLLLRRWRLTVRLAGRLERGAAAGLDSPRLTREMLFLSLARYMVLAVRTVALGWLLLPALPWTGAAMGFAAVQISSLVALTPGNIGVTEWSWAALGAVYPSIGAGALAAFALALRLSGAIASWVVYGASALIMRQAARRTARLQAGP